MKIEDFQTSLKAHELRMKQKNSEKVIEPALQAKIKKKMEVDYSRNYKEKEVEKEEMSF